MSRGTILVVYTEDRLVRVLGAKAVPPLIFDDLEQRQQLHAAVHDDDDDDD